MTTALHINASSRGEGSDSLPLAELFLKELRVDDEELVVDRFDLFAGGLPEFGDAAAAAKMAIFAGKPQSDAQRTAWGNARAVFDRLDSADIVVMNVPFWNAGVPYVLKQFIDVVTQPGWCFGFDPNSGYTGLLKNKKAFVVYTSGVYAPGLAPAFGSDFTTSFIDDWLDFIGIVEHESVHFAPTVVNSDVVATRENAEECTRRAARRFASLSFETPNR